ncbi:MAG TPA: tyrosine-type recombinase/integrase, partial [Acidimicrobiales bacterium]
MASIRTTPERTFEVLYRDPAGRQRSKTFKRKTDATQFSRTVEADKFRGEWMDPRLAKAPFADYAAVWWESVQLAPKTRQLYKSQLRNWVLPRFGTVPVAAIDAPILRGWAKQITDAGRSASHRAGCINVVRLVLATAVEKGAIKVNPAYRLRLPTPSPAGQMHFLSPSEIEALAHAMDDPFDALLVRFAAYTGLRAGEIYGLRVRSLSKGRVAVLDSLSELQGGELVLRGTTKTGRNRVVPMPAALAEEMAALVAGRAPKDLVFAGPDGRPRSHSSYYKNRFKPALAKAGLPNEVRFHDLRHTCAAMLIGLGAHPKAIMERLGHASITVTLNTYGHLFPELEEALTDGLQGLWDSALP